MYILHVTIRINRRRIKKSLKMCGRKEGRAVAPPQHCTWNTVCLSHLEVWQQPWDKPGSAGWKPQKLDSKIRKMASHLNGCYMETAVTLFQKSSQKNGRLGFGSPLTSLKLLLCQVPPACIPSLLDVLERDDFQFKLLATRIVIRNKFCIFV